MKQPFFAFFFKKFPQISPILLSDKICQIPRAFHLGCPRIMALDACNKYLHFLSPYIF